jgi:hypothetical protein
MRLRKYLREEKVVPFLKARADLRATCTVTTPEWPPGGQGGSSTRTTLASCSIPPALLRRVRRRPRRVRRVRRRRAHGRALRRGLRKRGRWRSIIPPALLP